MYLLMLYLLDFSTQLTIGSNDWVSPVYIFCVFSMHVCLYDGMIAPQSGPWHFGHSDFIYFNYIEMQTI